VSPAGAYTKMTFPIKKITKSILGHMADSLSGEIKRAYVNKAEVRVSVENMTNQEGRNKWLLPTSHILLIKEENLDRFFKNKELPDDTCALLGQLTQDTDSAGNEIYYYSYDLSDLMTNQLRRPGNDSVMKMVLVPVTISLSSTSSTSTVTSVRQQQTISATKILSAHNGMKFELVYSGF